MKIESTDPITGKVARRPLQLAPINAASEVTIKVSSAPTSILIGISLTLAFDRTLNAIFGSNAGVIKREQSAMVIANSIPGFIYVIKHALLVQAINAMAMEMGQLQRVHDHE